MANKEITYKKLLTIQNVTKCLSSALIGSSFGLWLLNSPFFVMTLLLGGAGMASYFKIDEFDVRNCPDIKEIKKIYDEVIRNYVKLNKQFDFKNPLEIFYLYNYMRINGYLSVNKEFKYNKKTKHYDLPLLYGADVIKGKAICRHIASMLKDVYLEYGIDNNVLPVKFDSELSKIESYCKGSEELLQVWPSEELEKMHQKLLYSRDKLLNRVMNSKEGSHLINYVIFDGKQYILDPTNKIILTPNVQDGLLYNEENIMKPIFKSDSIYDKNYYSGNIDLNIISENFGLPIEEEEIRGKIKEQINLLTQENPDMLESFYQEHEEAYEDITLRLSKIKK